MILSYAPETICSDYPPTLRGLPALAVRIGRALERWGQRRAALPPRELRIRRYEALIASERRATEIERSILRRL